MLIGSYVQKKKKKKFHRNDFQFENELRNTYIGEIWAIKRWGFQ